MKRLLLALLVVATAAAAQDFPRMRRRPPVFELPPNVAYDGRFVFVRLQYTPSLSGFGFRRGGGPGWAHDYPRADTNFMRILDELTLLGPHVEATNIHALTDPALFEFPVAYLSEPGGWLPADDEVEALRAYLTKGGFLIFDDFRGRDWENLEAQMRRVLPDARFQRLDATHAIFHSFFEIDSLDFVQFYDQDLPPAFFGLFEENDPSKRLMAIANYNNDIGEYWEFSDTGWVPIDLSNEAYKLGVNYVMYALTH
jgi:hypothetical protein